MGSPWESDSRCTSYAGAVATVDRTICTNCGADRSTATKDPDDPGRWSPCPQCGSRAITHEVTATATIHVSGSATSVSLSGNNAQTRLLALQDAIDDADAAVTDSSARRALGAVKRALEAMHELNDDHDKRRVWSRGSWLTGDHESWKAHMGARNAAHHLAPHVVELHGHGTHDDRLRWAIDEPTLQDLDSAKQAQAYRTSLHGKPVLPELRRLAALVAQQVP